jgi:flagellar hook assembly protein FlgD
VATDADVDVQVFDVAGEKVRSFSPQSVSEGYYETYWNLENDSGAAVASGIYIWKVHARSRRGEEGNVYSKAAVAR